MKKYTLGRFLIKAQPSHFFVILLFVFLTKPVTASVTTNINIEPTPEWVAIRTLEPIQTIPINKLTEGTYFRLLDDQARVSVKEGAVRYSRLAKTIVNRIGIENSSQLNIDYDPAYQKLILHSIDVLRNGKQINKLTNARFSIIQREESLDKQIYDGTLTANIILDDIREGDTLDYSYSIYGDNPVYGSLFSMQQTISWSVPVINQYVRVLWGKPSPLYVHMRNIDVPVAEHNSEGYRTYQVHIHEQTTVDRNSESPDWYYPFGIVYFSELQNWRDIVNWALPLYASSQQRSNAIQEVAQRIKAKHSDKKEQIVSALKFVQNEIRYLGLEMGMNSHQPSLPETTLMLRYGDCKDKAVLFISILHQLGIDAFPVLVDTYNGKVLDTYPAMINSFNHVIVTLNYQEEQYWLDPTLTYQKGALSAIYQPDYGFGLVLKPGNTALTPMHNANVLANKPNSYQHINEVFTVPASIEEPVLYSVNTQYFGNIAQNMYYQIDNNGIKDLTERYLNFFEQYYTEITALAEIEVTNNEQTGVLDIAEHYSIAAFWEKDEEGFSNGFYATDIRNALYLPKQIKRTSPLNYRYPNNVKNRIEVRFSDDNWAFEDEEFVEDNPFFYFKFQTAFAKRLLTITYDYQSRTDHIMPGDVAHYLEARDRVRDKTYFGIIKYSQATVTTDSESDKVAEESYSTSQKIYFTLIVFYLVCIIFILVSWHLESKKRPDFENAPFYPISTFKFIVLSVMTWGIYLSYWMYRNWKYIKLKDNSSMMPIARAFFFPIFWFYPLYKRLVDDSNERFQRNEVFSKPLVILFAGAYFLLVVGARSSLYESIILLCTPFLFLPLVNYISFANGSNSVAYHYNSKWRIRHIVVCLLFVPVIILSVSQELYLTPNDNVIRGSQLWQHDIKFLQRNKLIPPKEDVVLFYSDAFLLIQDDGNGFTDSSVFSYWKDEDRGIQIKTALLADVKDIQVEFAEKSAENTVITVILDDDNSFILYASAEKKLDKKFVNELKSRWKICRGSS